MRAIARSIGGEESNRFYQLSSTKDKKQQKNKLRFHRHRSASIDLLVHPLHNALHKYIECSSKDSAMHYLHFIKLNDFSQKALQDHECTYVVPE